MQLKCSCVRKYYHYIFTLYLSMFFFFFFNDTATTEIYTLSLHDALPISVRFWMRLQLHSGNGAAPCASRPKFLDRKSTRLNSSHSQISYAVFCLKKKKTSKSNQNIPT